MKQFTQQLDGFVLGGYLCVFLPLKSQSLFKNRDRGTFILLFRNSTICERSLLYYAGIVVSFLFEGYKAEIFSRSLEKTVFKRISSA